MNPSLSQASSTPQPKSPAPLARVMRDRRQFLSGGGAMLAGGTIWNSAAIADVSTPPTPHSQETLRVGLIGCGQRGTAAAMELLSVCENVRVVALADRFANQLQSSFRALNGRHSGRVQIEQRRFVGTNAANDLIQSDLDAVIVATPPAFVPGILTQCATTAKHVWLHSEPGASEAGFDESMAACRTFQRNQVSVVFSSMRSDTVRMMQTLEQLDRGIIGEPVSAKILWNHPVPRWRESTGADDEIRIRNWQHDLSIAGPTMLRGTIAGWEILHRWAGDRSSVQVQCEQADAAGHRLDVHLIGTIGTCSPIAGVIRDLDGGLVWRSTAKGEPSPSATGWIDSISARDGLNNLELLVRSARSAFQLNAVTTVRV